MAKGITSISLAFASLLWIGNAAAETASGFELSGVQYTITSETTAEVSSLENFKETSLEIPASVELDGKTYVVEGIGKEAIGSYGKITTVKLPETLKYIGNLAFSGTKIKSIDLPEGLERIEEGAFSNSQLESISIPGNIKQLKPYTFFECKSLATVDLGEIEGMAAGAFGECISLKSVILPKTLMSVGSGAFKGCQLEYVEFDNREECPVLNSENVFGKSSIPYFSAPDESQVYIGIADIIGQYSISMPEMYAGKAAYTFDSDLDFTVSFAELPGQEFKIIDRNNLFAEITVAEENATDDSGMPAIVNIKSPITVTLDLSDLTEEEKSNVKILFNSEDMTSELKDDKFEISEGKPFKVTYQESTEGYKKVTEWVSNTVSIIYNNGSSGIETSFDDFEGEVLIYNLQGVLIAKGNDATELRASLPSGIYIQKIGKNSTKINCRR